MSTHGPLRPVVLLLAVAASAVSAQPRSHADATPSPGTAAQSLADSYRSTFAGYRRWEEAKLASWQQANETVRTIGGWRTYAKEAQESQIPAATGAPADSSGGHHTHGEGPAR